MTDIEDLLDGRTLYPAETANEPTRAGDGEDRPLAINELFASKSRRGLLDYFLSGDVDEDGENQSQIAEHSGVSRNSVGRHIDELVRFGIVEEKGDGAIRQYALNPDSELFQLLVAINEEAARAYQG